MLQFPAFMIQHPSSEKTIPSSFLLPSQCPHLHSEELLLAMEESAFEEKISEIRDTNRNMIIIGKMATDNAKEDDDNDVEEDDGDNAEESDGEEFEQETGHNQPNPSHSSLTIFLPLISFNILIMCSKTKSRAPLSSLLWLLPAALSSYIAFYYGNHHRCWTLAGAVLVSAAVVLAARATVMTWITLLVLLAFAGKRRRILALQGRKITLDVAISLFARFLQY